MSKKIQKKKTQSYEEGLFARLKDADYAAEYLNALLEQDDPEAFLLGVRDVARAHNFSVVAQKSKLGRESLYKALSDKGNPAYFTLQAVLKAVGIKVSFSPQKKAG